MDTMDAAHRDGRRILVHLCEEATILWVSLDKIYIVFYHRESDRWLDDFDSENPHRFETINLAGWMDLPKSMF